LATSKDLFLSELKLINSIAFEYTKGGLGLSDLRFVIYILRDLPGDVVYMPRNFHVKILQ